MIYNNEIVIAGEIADVHTTGTAKLVSVDLVGRGQRDETVDLWLKASDCKDGPMLAGMQIIIKAKLKYVDGQAGYHQ